MYGLLGQPKYKHVVWFEFLTKPAITTTPVGMLSVPPTTVERKYTDPHTTVEWWYNNRHTTVDWWVVGRPPAVRCT